MSLRTTLARGEANAQAARWDAHLAHCGSCSTARRARAWEHLCDDGADIWIAKRDADAALKRERQADRQPIPGQGTLL